MRVPKDPRTRTVDFAELMASVSGYERRREEQAARIATWKTLGSWTRVVEHEDRAGNLDAQGMQRGVTIISFATGWKAVPWVVDDLSRRHRAYVFALRSARTMEEACRDLIARSLLVDGNELMEVENHWVDRSYVPPTVDG